MTRVPEAARGVARRTLDLNLNVFNTEEQGSHKGLFGPVRGKP